MMKKRVFLTGQSGQVGREILTQHDSEKFSFYSHMGDITQTNSLTAIIENKIKPDIIINAAAYTNVEKAEKEIAKCFDVNAFAVEALAKAAKNVGAKFIHFSTDYVFGDDGCQAMPHDPQEDVTPMNMYGLSKALGEKLAIDANPQTLIFRTSWVYSERRNNFLKTMLKLANETVKVKVVDDEVGAPTSARLVAAATLHALEQEPLSAKGVYHITSKGEPSWADFAEEIFKQAKLPTLVERIPSDSYPTKAGRPKNSRLDTSSFESRFQYNLPDWRNDLARVISKLLESKSEGS